VPSEKIIIKPFHSFISREGWRPWGVKFNEEYTYALYCIYIYIYIAPLAVHTNQKCFQCERPREQSLENEKRLTS